MIASFEIKSFSRVDTRFFKSSTVKEELPLQFETFGSDKPMIAFSSSSNFLSTDFVKSLIASNSFMKKFWKEVELRVVSFSVGLRGLLGVCGTSNGEPGGFSSLSKYSRCKFWQFLRFRDGKECYMCIILCFWYHHGYALSLSVIC